MLALSFFGILHVPINVPALGLAVQEDDVDTNRELIAHGISNGLSGLVGSIQVSLISIIHHVWTDKGVRIILCMPIASFSFELAATAV